MVIESPFQFGLALVETLALISAAVYTYLKLRRKKDPAEIERLRRLGLGRTGRITLGEITELLEPEGESTALQLVYRYDVAGVTYEVTQDVSTMSAVAARASHLVGRGVSVKYDVKHPTNSIVACEVWSGISGISATQPEAHNALRASAKATGKS